jgi:FixJ family two-component response regulator
MSRDGDGDAQTPEAAHANVARRGREIAAELDTSVETVEAHKANGMSKLGMSSRVELVRFAILQGWLRES